MLTDKPLAFGNLVSEAFRVRLRELVVNLGWTDQHADWLMVCMAFETGETFSPSIRNPWSTATGLIQFMAATARQLGTSTTKLAAMSSVQQLAYVEAYFRPYAKRVRSLEDMYLAILWPRGVGQSLNWVLWVTGTQAYAVNRGLDLNRDGKVTKREATEKVRGLLQKGRQPGYIWNPDTPSTYWVQERLNSMGAGLAVDGVSGPLTRNALSQFQKMEGLPATGTATLDTISALRRVLPAPSRFARASVE